MKDEKGFKGSRIQVKGVEPKTTRFPEGEPFLKLDRSAPRRGSLEELGDSASEWKPFGELGKAERTERTERLNP
jgi:hypothetical protein